MPRVLANGIELEYEVVGDADDPALVLIAGLGAQLIDWPVEFCEQLAGHGLRVIRFDNRDAGLSASLDSLGTPDLGAVLSGDQAAVPYLLADMAADTVGLFDALGIGRAHLVGVSMGGMIAQQAAIDYPGRLLSLCSISSTTGDTSVGQATPEALSALARPRATSREQAVQGGAAASRVFSSPGFPVSDEELLRRAGTKYDRSYRPQGRLRQIAAVAASPDRTKALHEVTVPTMVVHGEADPLVNVSGGHATAAAIPGAELLVIPGMGHDLPRGAWPQIIEAVVRNTGNAALTGTQPGAQPPGR
jgi:pimeloyl-ACP methyl ester carboxylesterase